MTSEKGNNYSKIKRTLRIVGFLLLTVGAIFLVVGLIDFFNAFQEMRAPTLFVFGMLGLPVVGLGAGFTAFSFQTTQKDCTGKETVCTCGVKNDGESKFCKNCGKKF